MYVYVYEYAVLHAFWAEKLWVNIDLLYAQRKRTTLKSVIWWINIHICTLLYTIFNGLYIPLVYE